MYRTRYGGLLIVLLMAAFDPLAAQTAKLVTIANGIARAGSASDSSTVTVGGLVTGTASSDETQSDNGFGPAAWLLSHGPLIYTYAGVDIDGFEGDGGLALNAELNSPFGVAADAAGNVYIADYNNRRVRKVDATTGLMTTIAGNGSAGTTGDGGAAIDARMYRTRAVAVDAVGNVYFADFDRHIVRKVDVSTGLISRVAGSAIAGYTGDGGAATDARLFRPEGLWVDGAGDIYIADTRNHVVRKVDASTGLINTVVGSGGTGDFSGDGGAATAAALYRPTGVWVDDATGDIYLSDAYNHVIRKVDVSTGLISTVAGIGKSRGFSGDGGAATSAKLNYPRSIFLDASGHMFIGDGNSHRVRRVDANTGNILTVAGGGNTDELLGNGDAASEAELRNPHHIAIDGSGHLLIADRSHHRIRRVPWAAAASSGAGTDGAVSATAILQAGDSLRVRVEDADIATSLTVDIVNLTSGDDETLTLNEGPTGVFTGALLSTTSASSDGDNQLEVAAGDRIDVWYADAASASRAGAVNRLASAQVISLFGDVDGNNLINIDDLMSMLDAVDGGSTLSTTGILAANVDASGIYDGFDPKLADVLQVLLLQLGSISNLPVLDANSANAPPHTLPSPKTIPQRKREVALHRQGNMVSVWVDEREGLYTGELKIVSARGQVTLAAEMENYVQHSSADEEGLRISLVGPGAVRGAGEILRLHLAENIDDVELANVHFNGDKTSAIVAETVVLPTAFAMASNYPNPFNPETTIRFEVPHESTVRLEVFDIIGQRIAVLADGPHRAGFYRALWQGRDDKGRSVGSGVYFYRLQAEPLNASENRFVETRRMLLLK